MARLRVEVIPGASVCSYSLFVDGISAAMGPDHRGEAKCAGRCGDGSAHALLYSFTGAPGGTLSITLHCAADVVFRLLAGPIPESGPAWRAGREPFDL